MSQSINAAKKRRAVAQQPTPQNRFTQGPPQPPQPQGPPQRMPPPGQQQMPTQAPGLTLPQVIALIDTRLVTLERFMNDSKEGIVSPPTMPAFTQPVAQPQSQPVNTDDLITSDDLNDTVAEFDGRFQLLATELANLKDIVLSLQKYTMDVNKMLLESQQSAASSVVSAAAAASSDEDAEETSMGALNLSGSEPNIQFVMSSSETA